MQECKTKLKNKRKTKITPEFVVNVDKKKEKQKKKKKFIISKCSSSSDVVSSVAV